MNARGRSGVAHQSTAPRAALDHAVAVDGLGLAGADAEHDDAEEIAEIVPAAVVGHGVDRDLGANSDTIQATGKMKPCHRPSEEAGRAGATAPAACVAAQAVRGRRGRWSAIIARASFIASSSPALG